MASTRAEPKTESESQLAALSFARRVHLGQHRKQTGEQYVEHPIAVARLLEEAGCEGSVVTAAYLHDVVEKTPVQSDEIRLRFGDVAADVVDALTEDPGIEDYGGRKRALRRQVLAADRDAVLIYTADRLANVRDWRSVSPERRGAVAERLGTSLEQRLKLWSEDLDELTRHDPGLPFLGEIEVDLRALRSDLAEKPG